MSGRACKAAICCSGLSGKISKIDDLIVAGLITDAVVLDAIIRASETMDPLLDGLINIIRHGGEQPEDDD